MTLIMGIDPASQVTGWGVIECQTDGMHYRGASALYGRGHGVAARMARLSDGMAQLLRDYTPAVIAMEEAFVGRNSASALRLGEVRGMMMAHATHNRIEIVSYAARTIKKSVTGSGGASKQQVAMMVRHCLIGDMPSDLPQDSWDALAVALCHGFIISAKMKLPS